MNCKTLLDKSGDAGNRGLSNGPAYSYVKSFTEELHTRLYMEECVSGTKHFYWVPLNENKVTFYDISLHTSNFL